VRGRDVEIGGRESRQCPMEANAGKLLVSTATNVLTTVRVASPSRTCAFGPFSCLRPAAEWLFSLPTTIPFRTSRVLLSDMLSVPRLNIEISDLY